MNEIESPKSRIRVRLGRPSHGTVVGYVALFVALSAGAYAAGLQPNSVKSKHIVNGAVKAADLKDEYQESCEPGAIKGSVVVDTATLPQNQSYATVPGFNCAGSGVEVRRTGQVGLYFVRFVDNPSAGTAVVSSAPASSPAVLADAITASYERVADGTIGGETVFAISIHSSDSTNASGGGLEADQTFTLLAY